jgi:broad specificity phosphatase PhoE
LRRASLLAEKIGTAHGINVLEDSAFMEMGFGIFEGMTIEEAEERHPEAYDDFLNEFEGTTIPEGESYGVFSQRTLAALEGLLREGKDTLVVTHGGVMMEVISRLLELEAGACWNYHIGNCGFMEFKITDGKARLMNLVNCDHI